MMTIITECIIAIPSDWFTLFWRIQDLVAKMFDHFTEGEAMAFNQLSIKIETKAKPT